MNELGISDRLPFFVIASAAFGVALYFIFHDYWSDAAGPPPPPPPGPTRLTGPVPRGGVRALSDVETYRAGYPGQADDPDLQKNADFYLGRIPSKPEGDFIDNIHKDWFGDFDLLEEHHSYIQWLFPIREQGLNSQAHPLQLHEVARIKADPTGAGLRRLLRSYDMMMDFYGVRVVDAQSGKLARTEKYEERYDNLATYTHNNLRITRILKCLGEFGFEQYKRSFLDHFVEEIFGTKALAGRSAAESCRRYWIETLRSDAARDAVHARVVLLEQANTRGAS